MEFVINRLISFEDFQSILMFRTCYFLIALKVLISFKFNEEVLIYLY